ncbi:hypothetical protein M407DRAFT_32028 [Tulasnella calospora MUT 4182]|uniref:Uncharacterized protein n=1 Tax=Tulasnella calospora MUT 4182 TaxID=1051891 RepID=A0A0C3LA04_9AGAM|nr:hypothetical protein M407DRAFT_32028 [Tulasnella calospora MUT 4182]
MLPRNISPPLPFIQMESQLRAPLPPPYQGAHTNHSISNTNVEVNPSVRHQQHGQDYHRPWVSYRSRKLEISRSVRMPPCASWKELWNPAGDILDLPPVRRYCGTPALLEQRYGDYRFGHRAENQIHISTGSLEPSPIARQPSQPVPIKHERHPEFVLPRAPASFWEPLKSRLLHLNLNPPEMAEIRAPNLNHNYDNLKLRKVLLEHLPSPASKPQMVFSSDGKWLAVSNGKVVDIVDTARVQPKCRLILGSQTSIQCLAFSGADVLLGLSDCRILQVDFAPGENVDSTSVFYLMAYRLEPLSLQHDPIHLHWIPYEALRPPVTISASASGSIGYACLNGIEIWKPCRGREFFHLKAYIPQPGPANRFWFIDDEHILIWHDMTGITYVSELYPGNTQSIVDVSSPKTRLWDILAASSTDLIGVSSSL